MVQLHNQMETNAIAYVQQDTRVLIVNRITHASIINVKMVRQLSKMVTHANAYVKQVILVHSVKHIIHV